MAGVQIKPGTLLLSVSLIKRSSYLPLCARSAVIGAYMNVRINAAGYNDKAFVNNIISRGKDIETRSIALESEIVGLVNEKIGI